jgi:hypothetical protein
VVSWSKEGGGCAWRLKPWTYCVNYRIPYHIPHCLRIQDPNYPLCSQVIEQSNDSIARSAGRDHQSQTMATAIPSIACIGVIGRQVCNQCLFPSHNLLLISTTEQPPSHSHLSLLRPPIRFLRTPTQPPPIQPTSIFNARRLRSAVPA